MVAVVNDPDLDQAERVSRARRMIARCGPDYGDARIELHNGRHLLRRSIRQAGNSARRPAAAGTA
jgi:hypothetical protein